VQRGSVRSERMVSANMDLLVTHSYAYCARLFRIRRVGRRAGSDALSFQDRPRSLMCIFSNFQLNNYWNFEAASAFASSRQIKHKPCEVLV
jgi:hypothetical protein